MEKKVREMIAEKGLGRSHITILDALLKLRQVCCDPRLVPLAEAQKVKESAKLAMLLELVEELLEEGRRILIFSQFTSMLAIIEEALMQREVPLSKLTGSTRNREKVIERFVSGEAHVFLISLKAGGVGLNLTEADTVIHYDPWWNPAAEEQATDRAYRIGQDKPVFVYKLIIEDSVEEKILALQEKKKQLSNSLFSEKEEGVAALDAKSLLELFS
jgi:SNF2 family DNA or RNA helicase